MQRTPRTLVPVDPPAWAVALAVTALLGAAALVAIPLPVAADGPRGAAGCDGNGPRLDVACNWWGDPLGPRSRRRSRRRLRWLRHLGPEAPATLTRRPATTVAISGRWE